MSLPRTGQNGSELRLRAHTKSPIWNWSMVTCGSERRWRGLDMVSLTTLSVKRMLEAFRPGQATAGTLSRSTSHHPRVQQQLAGGTGRHRARRRGQAAGEQGGAA